MTTILEALQNAQMNLETCEKMGMGKDIVFAIAKNQLDNAIRSLDKDEDVSIHDEVEVE